jgi:hypothetical protein
MYELLLFKNSRPKNLGAAYTRTNTVLFSSTIAQNHEFSLVYIFKSLLKPRILGSNIILITYFPNAFQSNFKWLFQQISK